MTHKDVPIVQEKSELETDTYPSLNRDGLYTN